MSKKEEEKKRKYILFNKDDGRTGPKPCAFFASAAGCKNGSKCPFSHDPAASMPAPAPKASVSAYVPPQPYVPPRATTAPVVAAVSAAAPAVKTVKPVMKEAVKPPVMVQSTPAPATVSFNSASKKAKTAVTINTPMSITPMSRKSGRNDAEMDDDSQFLFGAVNEALKGGMQPSPYVTRAIPTASQQSQMGPPGVFAVGTSSSTNSGGSGKKSLRPPRNTPGKSTSQSVTQNVTGEPMGAANGSYFLAGMDVLQRLSTNQGHGNPVLPPAPTGSASKKARSRSSSFDVITTKTVPTNSSFLFGNLPVAAPSGASFSHAEAPRAAAPAAVPTPPSDMAHLSSVLQALITKTREHPRYARDFAFEDRDASWARTNPYGEWCSGPNYPQIIGIDCEMCETTDPVSGVKDVNALIRLSIINGEEVGGNHETVLDTLVNPLLPVTDCRTSIHGIVESQLQNVQFTLKHAQAALMQLCSDNTVIIGHSVHNDLRALKFLHSNSLYIDTSYLFEVENEPGKAPSLRDIAQAVCNTSLAGNRTHDSVQDAKIAVQAVNQLTAKLGQGPHTPAELSKSLANIVIPRLVAGLTQPAAQCLLVHRIPSAYTVEDIKTMFSTCAFVIPLEVQPITYGSDENTAAVPGTNIGKTVVAFSTEAHADLAFESLTGPNRPDKNQKAQKRVYLKNGGHICVRKY